MKSFVTVLFIFHFFVGCGQNSNEVHVIFQPKEKITYEYEMKSNQLNLIGILDMDFTVANNLNTMRVEIVNLNVTSSDGQDLGYHEFIKSSYTRQYNFQGESTDKDNLPKQIINTDLFVVEFPKMLLKEGSRWNAIKTAKPDMFFDNINVEYVCDFINLDTNVAIIDAEMNFESLDKSTSDMKMTRKFTGKYIVDLTNGVVTNAKFYMDMFSGLSQLKGTIEIRKL